MANRHQVASGGTRSRSTVRIRGGAQVAFAIFTLACMLGVVVLGGRVIGAIRSAYLEGIAAEPRVAEVATPSPTPTAAPTATPTETSPPEGTGKIPPGTPAKLPTVDTLGSPDPPSGELAPNWASSSYRPPRIAVIQKPDTGGRIGGGGGGTTGTEAGTKPGILKAVVIVGPSEVELASNYLRAEEFARAAEKHGMEVRRVYHPHATWQAVLANIQGANLVAYFGHGNGYPSPYGSFQERTKDGFGLDTTDGAQNDDVTYYGATQIIAKIKLAPNAVVALSHLCYASGNGEPGMPLPDWITAWKRVDNFASGFIGAGAMAVFAYGAGSIAPIVDGLFTTDKTMDQIFMTPGAKRQPLYGFVDWADQWFASDRVDGARNHLDPGQTEGFVRAVTGYLDMTTADWLAGATKQ